MDRGGFRLTVPRLELPAAGLIVVGGASGAGKTSLLRLLVGREAASQGAVLGGPPPQDWAYLPQLAERALAGRNLAEDLTGRVRPDPGTRTRLREALARVGLAGVPLSRRSSRLSAGERRRVALALALVTDRPHWAMDEPDAALDEEGRRRWVGILDDRLRHGGSIVLTTHRVPLYRTLSPFVVALVAGEVVTAGPWGSPEVREGGKAALGLAGSPSERFRAAVGTKVPPLRRYVSETSTIRGSLIPQVQEFLEDSQSRR
jgi:ABC-type transport system involved in cytochrome c biogenesis ATPase subunit